MYTRNSVKSFKPCNQLTHDDLTAHPIWGFDLSLEGVVKGADESWVRPYEYRTIPETSDLLFAVHVVIGGQRFSFSGAITLPRNMARGG